MTQSDIIGALPSLTEDQLTEVVAVASSLINGRAAALAVEGADTHSMLFDALRAAVGSTMPFVRLPASGQKAFDAKIPGVCRFLDKYFAGWDSHKVTQLAFLRMLADLLSKDILQVTGHKATTVMMINNLHRLPEVIESAFPGYLTSSLGQLILNQFRK